MADLSIRITKHAARQAERRGLELDTVHKVLRSPEQTIPVRPGREIRQSFSEGAKFLIRVVVDVTDHELIVVTMYRTSKVQKYRQP